MTKAGIAIDPWKLSIFERHLSQAGYIFDKPHEISPAGVLLMTVRTENLEALAGVIEAANIEAAKTGAPL